MPPPVIRRRFPPGGPRWRVHGSRRWPRWSLSWCSVRRPRQLPAPGCRRASLRRPPSRWPPSSGLLVAEVVTGGASASDEYVELTNASATSVDLAGLEVAYVTSSGSTVTRKASWSTPLALEPGRHLLVANASGIYAASADATYTGGFAATGGALVVRPIGGQPVDAVAWGDATNAFVEGVAAASSGGGQLDRATAGRSARQLRRHERQLGRLRRQRRRRRPRAWRPDPSLRRARRHRRALARRVGDAEPDAVAHADTDCEPEPDVNARSAPHAEPDANSATDADPDADARPRRRPRPRRRRPTPTPTPTPAPTPTASPTPCRPRSPPRRQRRAPPRSDTLGAPVSLADHRSRVD